MMNKKKYTAPEAEVEVFEIKADVVTTSGLDDNDNVIDLADF